MPQLSFKISSYGFHSIVFCPQLSKAQLVQMAHPTIHSRISSASQLLVCLQILEVILQTVFPKSYCHPTPAPFYKLLEKSPNAHFIFVHDSSHARDFYTLGGEGGRFCRDCYSSPNNITKTQLETRVFVCLLLHRGQPISSAILPLRNQDISMFCKLLNDTQLVFKSSETQVGS